MILLATPTEDVELCVEAAIETSEEVSCSPKNQDVAMGWAFREVSDRYCLVLTL